MNFLDKTLEPVWRKVQAQTRLDLDDVRTLDASPDILGVGWMAKQVKQRLYGLLRAQSKAGAHQRMRPFLQVL
jgi:hypothetical protein